MDIQMHDRVEYTGPDDEDSMLYRGQPGHVWDVNLVPAVTIVSFVNGPSLDFSDVKNLALLPFDEYVRRGRRLVAHRHPLEDREVPTLMAPGSEWPEGQEPVAE